MDLKRKPFFMGSRIILMKKNLIKEQSFFFFPTGPFHMTGFSGPQQASEMEAKDDFVENPACHSADCGDLDDQDCTTGETPRHLERLSSCVMLSSRHADESCFSFSEDSDSDLDKENSSSSSADDNMACHNKASQCSVRSGGMKEVR